MTPKEKLDTLSALHAEAQKLSASFEERREAALPERTRLLLSQITAEEQQAMAEISAKIASLKAEIEADTLGRGETVKGTFAMAVFNKGKETWDGKLLSGFALAHPEILTARKIGAPFIVFRNR